MGPTASGKSSLADALALELGTSVVSADSMQVYRGMDIGTAKTPVGERPVPLLCVDIADPGQTFSAAEYAELAHQAIDGLIGEGKTAVVCGGTGLYVRAALEDMAFAAGEQVDNPVREHYQELAQELGPQGIHKLLAQKDPASAAIIHPNNVRRVVRAFELLEQGTTYAVKHEGLQVRINRHPTRVFGLAWDRDPLYRRIDARVDQMMGLGLVDEVRGLVQQGLADSLTSRQAIGYKEVIEALRAVGEGADEGEVMSAAVDLIKMRSRRYAKRQMTWFRKDPRVEWLDATHATTSQLLTTVIERLTKEQVHG